MGQGESKSVNYAHETGWFAAKVGAKVTMNTFLPGSGVFVDVCDCTAQFCRGEVIGGSITLGFAIFNLIPFVGSMIGDSAKASLDTAKASGQIAFKEVSKEVGKQASKQIAKNSLAGVAKHGVVEGTKLTAEVFGNLAREEMINRVYIEAQKNLMKQVGINGAKNLVQATATEVGKSLTKTAVEDAVITAGIKVIEEFAKDTSKAVAQEFAESITKEVSQKLFAETTKHLAYEVGERTLEEFLKETTKNIKVKTVESILKEVPKQTVRTASNLFAGQSVIEILKNIK